MYYSILLDLGDKKKQLHAIYSEFPPLLFLENIQKEGKNCFALQPSRTKAPRRDKREQREKKVAIGVEIDLPILPPYSLCLAPLTNTHVYIHTLINRSRFPTPTVREKKNTKMHHQKKRERDKIQRPTENQRN